MTSGAQDGPSCHTRLEAEHCIGNRLGRPILVGCSKPEMTTWLLMKCCRIDPDAMSEFRQGRRHVAVRHAAGCGAQMVGASARKHAKRACFELPTLSKKGGGSDVPRPARSGVDCRQGSTR